MAKDSLSEQYRQKMKESLKQGESRYAQLKANSARGGLSWEQADAQSLRDAVAAVTEDGAAILLSKTSDGGALVVRIVDDSANTPFYPASTSALYDLLIALAATAGKG